MTTWMTLGDPKVHILKVWGQYIFIWQSFGNVEANWDTQTQTDTHTETWSVLEMLAHLKIPAKETFIVINWISEIYRSLANSYYLFKLNDQDMMLK